MSARKTLFAINPAHNLHALRQTFALDGHLQIRDFLTAPAAAAVVDVLARQTSWGMAWQADTDGPHFVTQKKLRELSNQDRRAISTKLVTALKNDQYAFSYACFPILTAYKQKWSPGSPQDLLIEHLNDEPFLNLMRNITGIRELIKADGQATLYQPNQFLSVHDDSNIAEGRRVAYVMNFCTSEWRPEWGGYLNFHDQQGNVTFGYRPRFNALNLFLVPRAHSVSFVPSFAPIARYAITGWLRDI